MPINSDFLTQQQLKISVITVCYNAGKTLARCIESIVSQTYSNIEYIIIDGASTDNTLQIISQYKSHIDILVSEPDEGIYDAMNKGIKLAAGDIIGVLNADDYFASDDVISSVAQAFINLDTDIVYGNLNYRKPNGEIARKWRSGDYQHGMFNWGWMPPHPTFYCKRQLFEKNGYYDLQYGTAADYELMLRFMHANEISAYFLNKVMINMEIGGVSNKNYNNRITAWGNDYKAMGKNGVLFPRICLLFKPIRKIFQYI